MDAVSPIGGKKKDCEIKDMRVIFTFIKNYTRISNTYLY